MFSYANRKGVTYFLHAGKTKTGKTRYAMKRSSDGALKELPDGYEVVENVNAKVSVRKVKPRQIEHLEEKLVRTALRSHGLSDYRIEIKGRQITIHEPMHDIDGMTNAFQAIVTGGLDALGIPLDRLLREQFGDEFVDGHVQHRLDQQKQYVQEHQQYWPVFRFLLANEKTRTYAVERMYYSGEGGWHFLEEMPLAQAIDEFFPHLGKESFFDLI